eukprot:6172090-Pleurochrysis_carterae.AAC.1
MAPARCRHDLAEIMLLTREVHCHVCFYHVGLGSCSPSGGELSHEPPSFWVQRTYYSNTHTAFHLMIRNYDDVTVAISARPDGDQTKIATARARATKVQRFASFQIFYLGSCEATYFADDEWLFIIVRGSQASSLYCMV